MFERSLIKWGGLIGLFGLLLVLTATARVQGEGSPATTRQALTPDGQMRMSPSDRCPVCAMYPARRPDAAAALTLIDGTTFYFCSNGCLLRTWLRPMAYLGQSRDQIDRMVVRDYFSGQPIDARKATWVAGSDVVGPMGPAIIALGTPTQLETFTRRHGGRTVFTFDDVNDDLWKRISQRELPSPTTE